MGLQHEEGGAVGEALACVAEAAVTVHGTLYKRMPLFGIFRQGVQREDVHAYAVAVFNLLVADVFLRGGVMDLCKA